MSSSRATNPAITGSSSGALMRAMLTWARCSLVIIESGLGLAAEDAVGDDVIADDERQYHRGPREGEFQRGPVRGGLPDRHPVDHHVGEEAVGEAREGERENR